MLERLGTFLVEITDSRRGRILLVIAISLLAGLVEFLSHGLVATLVPNSGLSRILDSTTIALIVAVITGIEIKAVQQRRQQVLYDMRTVSELNHHVRNALQVISYAARVPETEQQVAIIDESVARIDATLKQLFPTIDK